MARKAYRDLHHHRRSRRLRRWFIKFLIYFAAILIIVFGLGALSHLKALTINNIEIKDSSFASSNSMFLKAKEVIAGNYFHLFSRSNTFIFPKGQIKTELLADNPSINSITISRKGLNSLTIAIQEYKPFALWCVAVGDCYFLNNNGEVFYRAPNYSVDPYFAYFGMITDTDPIGKQFLEANKFKSISDFIDRVKKLNLDIVSLTAVNATDFRLKLRDGAEIRFDPSTPLDQILSNIATIVDKNRPGEAIDLNNLNYLDLRFGNKVYYKYNTADHGIGTTSGAQN